MTLSSPTEQLVEDVAAVYFGAIGAIIKRGVEIDDAGERGGAAEVVLKGRLGVGAASPQPRSAARHRRGGRAHPVAPAAPDADPEQPLVPRAAHRRRRGRVPRREERRDARRTRAARRLRRPGRQRSAGGAPAQRRRSVGQDHPPGPDGVPERAADRGHRAEGPDRHRRPTSASPSTSSTATCRPRPTCSCRTWCWWSRTGC